MVKYITENGEVKNLNKQQFLKLMRILKNRAKLQHDEKVIAEFTKKWN